MCHGAIFMQLSKQGSSTHLPDQYRPQIWLVSRRTSMVDQNPETCQLLLPGSFVGLKLVKLVSACSSGACIKDYLLAVSGQNFQEYESIHPMMLSLVRTLL